MCGVTKVWMQGLMRKFSDSSAILKEWGVIGLLEGCTRGVSGKVDCEGVD